LALGTISSLLLSAGLSKAAQKLDPLTKSIASQKFGFGGNDSPTNNCVSPCFYEAE